MYRLSIYYICSIVHIVEMFHTTHLLNILHNMTWTVMYCGCMPVAPAKYRERTIILTTVHMCACNNCEHRA